MIDNINGMIEEIKKNSIGLIGSIHGPGPEFPYAFRSFDGEYFCPNCGGFRKGSVIQLTGDNAFKYSSSKILVLRKDPWLLQATCKQCEHKSFFLIYYSFEGIELIIIHDTYSGIITPNTPNSVKYYLDQAYRARSFSANSAAAVMYRSALECLLFEQGFKNGMLKDKINQLEKSISNNSAPNWAKNLNIEYLKAIKNIGNGAIHTNGGDIDKQKEIDKALVELIDIIFMELLDIIYEQAIRSNNNLNKLKQKVGLLK